MTVAVKQPKWSAATFLEWSASQEGRYELENGQVITLQTETARHARTKHGAAKALERAIEQAGLDCEVFPDGMTVVVDNHNVRLPDAAIQCAPVDDDTVVLDTPIILVEVSSPSSVNRDENYKLVEYFSIPSVAHYLLISPNLRTVIHFKRGVEPGHIETNIVSEGPINLSPPGFSVRVEDLLGSYAGKKLEGSS